MSVLNNVDAIVQRVTAWDGVTAQPHRFGGIEFNLGAVEVGHVHRSGMVDIPFTRRLREQLIPAGEAELHHLLPETGWITFYVRHDADVDQAVRLFRLSYLQKSRRRGMTGDRLQSELDALGFDASINAVLIGKEEHEDSA
jgi:hypothetical protein